MQLPSKIGAESRPKLIAAIVLMAVAVVLFGQWVFGGAGSPSVPTTAVSSAAASVVPVRAASRIALHARKKNAPSLDPTLRYDWLKASEDTEYKGSGRNIFQAQMEIPQPQSNGSTDHARMPDNSVPVVTGPPPPPPIDLKFFGFASRPGETKKVFLSQGEDVFIATEGEIIDRRYKILRISPMSVEVEDLLNNNRQEIPLTQG